MLHAMRPVPKPIRALKTKKRKKVSSRTMLEKRLDCLIREIVLDRDQYCVCPAPKKGHSDILQNGHLISRARKMVKYDLRNCSVNCGSCNFIHEHSPERYTRVFLDWYGKEEYDKLCADSEEIGRPTLEELETLLSELMSIRRRQMDNMDWKPRFSQKQILSGEWRNYEREVSNNMSRLLVVDGLQPQPIGR